MTSSARPNLGGLFNGSTPAQRPSRIAEAGTPRLATPPPVPAPPARSPSAESGFGPAAEPAAGPGDQAGTNDREAAGVPTTPPNWLDPVTLVNQYFQFLRTLLDVNQQWAVTCATAVVALPRRIGLRR